MSDPHGETPHSNHPQEDDFSLEMPIEHEDAAPLGHHEEAAEEPHPLDVLGLNSSADEFQFAGPVEELDFFEPTDFTFPSAPPAEAEVVSDSTNLSAAEHGGMEYLFGAEEAVPAEPAAVDDAVAEAAPASDTAEAEPAAEETEEESKARPKRELPAWVHTLEWTAISLLAIGALIALIVSVAWVSDPDMVTLVWNIACPAMLALIPYALWRSNSRWRTPSGSVLYTMLLVVSATVLIGGTWVEGMELAGYKWQFNKTRIAAGKPHPKFVAPPPEAADAGNPSNAAAGK